MAQCAPDDDNSFAHDTENVMTSLDQQHIPFEEHGPNGRTTSIDAIPHICVLSFRICLRIKATPMPLLANIAFSPPTCLTHARFLPPNRDVHVCDKSLERQLNHEVFLVYRFYRPHFMFRAFS